MKHLVALVGAYAIANVSWSISRRKRKRQCCMCGCFTRKPIHFDSHWFDDETCRALYECDKYRFYDKCWEEQNKDVFGF